MTLAKAASIIAKREGGKSQARIGDIRQILKIIVDDTVEKVTSDNEDTIEKAIFDAIEKKLDQLTKKAAIKAQKKK